MPKKKKSGGGFQPTVREKINTKGYKTIFEKIVEKANGEERSLSWYQTTLGNITSDIKILSDEHRDDSDQKEFQDENVMRHYVLPGHLYFFRYEAKMRWLPYYDRFPLVYVLKSIGEDHFYGANLHYVNPKNRVKVINSLNDGLVDIPKTIIHKYINDHVKSLFLDLASVEWETSILLPVEDFVTTRGSGKIPYKRTDVWKENDRNFNDRIKGKRIIKKYTDE